MKMLICVLMILSLGCAEQSEQKYKDRAEIEGKADAQSETEEINKRAQQMEKDLARLQNFYEGVNGVYEGQLPVGKDGQKMRIRFAIGTTIGRYEGSRIRTADEITFDLTNVAFDILENTVSKMSGNSDISFGCQYFKVRPAVEAGFFRLSEEGCPRSFVATLLPQNVGVQSADVLNVVSRGLALDLLDQRIKKVPALQVEMRSIHLAEPVEFVMHRK